MLALQTLFTISEGYNQRASDITSEGYNQRASDITSEQDARTTNAIYNQRGI